jgi:hypothetical protein
MLPPNIAIPFVFRNFLITEKCIQLINISAVPVGFSRPTGFILHPGSPAIPVPGTFSGKMDYASLKNEYQRVRCNSNNNPPV